MRPKHKPLKMSRIFLDYITPISEQYDLPIDSSLLKIAVSAWNIALQDEAKREKIMREVLAEAVSLDQNQATQQLFKDLTSDLIALKVAMFSDISCAIQRVKVLPQKAHQRTQLKVEAVYEGV
jgi:hypothetical protein